MTNEAAKTQGWEAYRKGKSSNKNPFCILNQSKLFDSWEQGWFESHDTYLAKIADNLSYRLHMSPTR